MRITRIEPQKNRPGRKNLYADGTFLAGVSDETLLRLKLRTGDELSPEILLVLQKTEELHSARNVALRFLSYRPRTEREIRDKLREKEFADPEIAQTVTDLKGAGLLNDREFARMYIRDTLAARATGRMLLKRKMLLLGLDRTTVDESLEEAFSGIDQLDAALGAANKFLRRSRTGSRAVDEAKMRKRLAGFLGRRGYAWDVIDPVLRRVLSGKHHSEEPE